MKKILLIVLILALQFVSLLKILFKEVFLLSNAVLCMGGIQLQLQKRFDIQYLEPSGDQSRQAIIPSLIKDVKNLCTSSMWVPV